MFECLYLLSRLSGQDGYRREMGAVGKQTEEKGNVVKTSHSFHLYFTSKMEVPRK